MCSSKAYIRDHQSLIELNNVLDYSADSILKILESVNSYLEGVQEALSKQMAMLEEELQKAKEKLAKAEKALSDCKSSQKWDEEDEVYRPSCSSETSRVQSAREKRDLCQEKYDKAQHIVNECKSEIDKYKQSGGFIIPPGGEKTLEYIAQEHTDKATAKMKEILEVVEEYLKCSMSIKSCYASSAGSIPAKHSDSSGNNEDKPLSQGEKKEKFANAIQKVIARQHSENYGDRQIADANRVMICPGCKRPLVACICPHTREREYTRSQNQLIKNDFSR